MASIKKNIKSEIIVIGTEILIGQTLDTNSGWMGGELTKLGIENSYRQTISDTRLDIENALNIAINRVDIVILTGGLGPTSDDITKYVLTDYFDTTLKLNKDVETHLKSWYAKRDIPFLQANKQQAMLPKDAVILRNDVGSASGMLFEKNGKIIIVLPGVPYEMKHLFGEKVIPELHRRFELSQTKHQTVRVVGVKESILSNQLKDWENTLKQHGLNLAYLPSLGQVKLRISGEGIQKHIETLKPLLAETLLSENDEEIEVVIGHLLKKMNKTVGTAESCTAGQIASCLTNISGSSNYVMGGIVAYDNAVKEKVLGVQKTDLEMFGAVSEQVVSQMAQGARAVLETDFSIATSGILGPLGGTTRKPVGTIWMAVASNKGVETKPIYLPYSDRAKNKKVAVLYALNMLRLCLQNVQSSDE